MPKRKHVKKNPVVACSDANQHVRESLKEKARIAAARQRRFEELQARYLEEAKKREEEKKKAEELAKLPQINPTVEPESVPVSE